MDGTLVFLKKVVLLLRITGRLEGDLTINLIVGLYFVMSRFEKSTDFKLMFWRDTFFAKRHFRSVYCVEERERGRFLRIS